MAALKLGALGGAVTFGAQAAAKLTEVYSEFSRELTFYPTAEEAYDAVASGTIDAMCAPEQLKATGFHTGSQGKLAGPDARFFVMAEVAHEFHANLLVKPGTPLDKIRQVQGHTGSVTQSEAWIRKNLPWAEIFIVDTSSYGAAQTVLDSDGSIASVGTHEAALQFGLEEKAKDIDNGSIANYFAFTARPIYADEPTRLVVAGRFGGDGQLTALVQALSRAGYNLLTVYNRVSGEGLFLYDYVMRFGGSGHLAAVQDALGAFKTTRLVGAFVARE
ncbi:MAG TPA: prephenate dehydratase domain-containing protein [Chloroflexota bacterium]|nr:prephenate dehydratase domain-containing protein [Chloroflexota bacterium]